MQVSTQRHFGNFRYATGHSYFNPKYDIFLYDFFLQLDRVVLFASFILKL